MWLESAMLRGAGREMPVTAESSVGWAALENLRLGASGRVGFVFGVQVFHKWT